MDAEWEGDFGCPPIFRKEFLAWLISVFPAEI
nr:MAG TPA: hypothetical protein [Caudoviricetes sp.]